MEEKTYTHPSFKRAAELEDEFWRAHFPKSVEEAQAWKPYIKLHALAMRVLAVAQTRVEFGWAAYIDSVPGMHHDLEYGEVLSLGNKLGEPIARALFPNFKDIPYCD